MADITLENGTDGLFDLLGEVFALQTQIDASVSDRRTAWASAFAAINSEFDTAQWLASLSSAEKAVATEESTTSAVAASLKSVAEQIVIAKVDEAVSLTTKTIYFALTELVRQMVERSESLVAPTVDVDITPDGGNTGDGFLIAGVKNVFGVNNPQIFDETMDVSVVSSGFLIAAGDATSNGLSPDGFGGSGFYSTLTTFPAGTAVNGSNSSGVFTVSASVLPGDWVANVGTLGTAVLSGQPQKSTITITGTPTTGTYRITLTTSSLGTQSTGNLSYSASASQIAAAINLIPGYRLAAVVASGTNPNFIHTLTFYGMREAVTVAVVESTDSGSFSISTPTAFSSPSLGSSPIVLVSDGSTLVSVSLPLSYLLPNSAYAVNAWLALNTGAASGVIEFSLTNGIGGTVIQDDAGNDLKFTVAATSLTTAFKGAANLVASGSPIFLTPSVIPASVYLRIRCSTTLPNTRQVFIESPLCAAISPLYQGGPYLVGFAGPVGFLPGDEWEVDFQNDHGGTMHWGMLRNFDIRRLGLMVPTDAVGTIADFTVVT